MPTPTYSTVISQINTFIVANGKNEITANVLNPILKLLIDFSNNTIGDLGALTADKSDNIVAALKSLKDNINAISNGGIKLFTGHENPNLIPPLSFSFADFFMQLSVIDNSPVELWQWNGNVWSVSGATGATGATGAAQIAQLQQVIYKNSVKSTAVTGTVSSTLKDSVLIAANAFSVGDTMRVKAIATHTIVSSAQFNIEIWINTSNTLSGATQIGMFSTSVTTQTYTGGEIDFDFKVGDILEFVEMTTSGTLTDTVGAVRTRSTVSLNPANYFYLIFALKLENSTNSAFLETVIVTKLPKS